MKGEIKLWVIRRLDKYLSLRKAMTLDDSFIVVQVNYFTAKGMLFIKSEIDIPQKLHFCTFKVVYNNFKILRHRYLVVEIYK